MLIVDVEETCEIKKEESREKSQHIASNPQPHRINYAPTGHTRSSTPPYDTAFSSIAL